jgi:putative NADPH-quinone reductase
MEKRKVLILDAHPGRDPGHFVHALAAAYAEAAGEAGHEVRRLVLAQLEFPLVREPKEWLEGAPPADIAAAQADLKWAEHLVILYPLWLGDVPALLKGFLEQALRPGFAFAYGSKGLPKKLLKGRSARVVVTMGMPSLFYRLVYGAHSVKSLERNVLKFVGFKPVARTLVGQVEDEKQRKAALEEMRELGARAE